VGARYGSMVTGRPAAVWSSAVMVAHPRPARRPPSPGLHLRRPLQDVSRTARPHLIKGPPTTLPRGCPAAAALASDTAVSATGLARAGQGSFWSGGPGYGPAEHAGREPTTRRRPPWRSTRSSGPWA
jgi:hypothetical protein